MNTACPSDSAYFLALNRRCREQRVPLSGTVDLTLRCNLRCRHCYAADAPAGESGSELPTERLLALFDELVDAGCLFLLFTGGEPLLRRDFARIYTHAKRAGLMVTVFANGTLIDEEAACLFADLPPRAVEISLYGATAATHDAVTGVPGSFARARAGLDRLLARRVPVKLKTVLMTLNDHEFEAMEELARACGVKFRVDPAIFPRFNGDRAPLALRVPAERAVACELADPERLKGWRTYFERAHGRPLPDRLYQCAAGITSFHVDSSGNIQPCVMTPHLKVPLREGRFRDAWARVGPLVAARSPGPAFPCNTCDKRAVCGFCPGFFRLENGVETAHSHYLCALGERRLRQLKRG
ncbi:MAG: radical SAM protein [Kiritimatiellae bacterium]|nr:radical SAM protein [Kiritimatiellia bacterium]